MTPFGVRQFRKLVVGCVAINIVTFVLVMTGNVLAGNFLGERALSGVSLASPFLTFGSFLISLIGGGMGINYSLRRGALDRDGATSAFMHGVWLILAVALGVGGSSWLLRDAYVGMMSSDAEIVRNAVEYWRWLPVGLALMCLSGFVINCCYCDGDTTYATCVCVGQCAVTLLVSYLALRAGHGAASCSFGYAVGYAFSGSMLALHFLRRGNTFSFRWCFSWREFPVVLRTSLGDSLSFLGASVVYTTLGFVLSRSFGPAALIGLPVYILIAEFVNYSEGFASAMQPIVAVYFGEGNHRSVRRVVRSVMVALSAVSIAMTVVLWCFPNLVLSLVGIDDPGIVPYAEAVVRIVSLRILPIALMSVMNNYYQLIRRGTLSVVFTFLYWTAFPIALMMVFPVFGERAFWYWTIVATWGGAALFAAFLVLRYGRRQFPLLLDREREAKLSVFDLGLSELDIATTAERISRKLMESGVDKGKALRARLLVEETLMVIKEHNGNAKVYAEVTLDLNDGIAITMRDDGEIFDITDADAKVNGLRTYLVATMMQHQSEKSNILTTGFNRNVFRL